MGLTGLMVDDRAGGLGMNEVDFVLLLEETGRVGGPPALGRSTENSRRTIRRPRPRDVRGVSLRTSGVHNRPVLTAPNLATSGLADFEREAYRYFDDVLGPEMKLKDPQPVSRLARGLVLFAASDRGRVVVKVYPASMRAAANRCAVAHEVFRSHGVRVPGLLWRDTNGESAGGPACLVWEFVEGEHPAPLDARMMTRGFANLASVHAIPAGDFDDPAPSAMSPRTVDHGWPLHGDGETATLRKNFRRALGPFGRIDTGRLDAWIAAAVARTEMCDLSEALLHGDYHANNLIFGDDGPPVTIDFDNAHSGRFSRELAVCLVRWRYRKTVNVPLADPRELRGDELILSAEAWYFSVAPRDAAEYWFEHRETFLLAAYARAIRVLVHRACDAAGYNTMKRLRYRRVAISGWRRLAAQLRCAGNSPK
jgi:Ser/Thr protein kinase RdoA (MazF antagonist)